MKREAEPPLWSHPPKADIGLSAKREGGDREWGEPNNMLRFLTIRNFAVISELHLELTEGLNVFTGQTGAGKSIVIEALGFLLGARGSLDWLRTGAPRLEVTGAFDREDFPKEIQARFKIDQAVVLVRRELESSGKTRATIHNQSAPLAVLAEWGDGLVDFHGQHEHQTLLKSELQLELLDGFGGLDALRQKVAAVYEKWSQLGRELKSLELSDEERLRRVDLYRYQLTEINEANLKPGEEEELEETLPRIKNAERIGTFSNQVYALLYEQEGSVQENLLKAERSMEELARLDPTLGSESASLAQARLLVQEVASKLSHHKDQLESGLGRMDDIHSRLDRIGRLKKKYGAPPQTSAGTSVPSAVIGATVIDVLAYRDRIQTELSWLENSEARAEGVQKALAQAQKDLTKLCNEIHKARMAAGTKLSSRVTRELKGLGMDAAKFSISVEMEEERYGPAGSDQVEFLIAPNPGEPLKALRSIASGGELSRVMLALKTVLAKNDRVKVLVFDEVDSGVSGDVGRAVGERLSELSKSHQVLCVTHLPQVACFGSKHFNVAKEVTEGRTFVKVESLDGDRRLEILARMLGGREVTAVSRKHALELLESCR